MRTLMLLASVAMTVAGVFCVANGSAAFVTVAFIIGIVFLLMGAIEVLIGIRADFDMAENAVSITKDGIIMLIFGLAVITGMITDDTTAQMLFAMWLVIEGVLSSRTDKIDLVRITGEERLSFGLTSLMLVIGIYMFFNVIMFNLPVTLLIGIALILLGIRRFAQSFRIEYSRPSFITGNEEKLEEALAEEKRALAKAKEGIREQKNAQRRIQKIREDIEAENDVINNAAIRRREREMEETGEDA